MVASVSGVLNSFCIKLVMSFSVRPSTTSKKSLNCFLREATKTDVHKFVCRDGRSSADGCSVLSRAGQVLMFYTATTHTPSLKGNTAARIMKRFMHGLC